MRIVCDTSRLRAYRLRDHEDDVARNGLMRDQRRNWNRRARTGMHPLDGLVVIPMRAPELTHRRQIQNVRRRDLVVADVAEHRDDDRERDEIERKERVGARRRKKSREKRNCEREQNRKRERSSERVAIAPELLSDARHHRRSDERRAVIEVRAVTRKIYVCPPSAKIDPAKSKTRPIHFSFVARAIATNTSAPQSVAPRTAHQTYIDVSRRVK